MVLNFLEVRTPGSAYLLGNGLYFVIAHEREASRRRRASPTMSFSLKIQVSVLAN